jgi:hypothetical protein
MSSVVEQALGWAVVVGVVLAVVLGRRRGKATLAAAISEAHASGYAEGGKAAAAAYANQSVNVAVDASGRLSRTSELAANHACDDPYDCDVCGAVFARIAAFERRRVESSNRERELLLRSLALDATGNDGAGNDDHVARDYYLDGSSTRAVPVASGRSGIHRGSRPGGAADRDGVDGDAS